MSISYNQLDDSHLSEAARHDPTEWEKRRSKAEQSLEDAIDIAERRASLSGSSERSAVRRNLSRKSSGFREGQTSPRGKATEPASQDGSEDGSGDVGEEDPTKMKDWWKRTDSATLNRKPDSAIADEVTNTQFKNYSYKPQYDVAGVYCPEYFKGKDPNAGVVSH